MFRRERYQIQLALGVYGLDERTVSCCTLPLTLNTHNHRMGFAGSMAGEEKRIVYQYTEKIFNG
jgi:hypothetical protein